MISYLLSEGGGPLNAIVRLWKKYPGLQGWSQATTVQIEFDAIFDVQGQFPASSLFPRSKQATTKTLEPDLTAFNSEMVFKEIRQVKSEWAQ